MRTRFLTQPRASTFLVYIITVASLPVSTGHATVKAAKGLFQPLSLPTELSNPPGHSYR